MERYKTLFALLLVYLSSAASFATAELSTRGIASYEQLRKNYYTGALLLEDSQAVYQDADSLLAVPGSKRMEIRVSAAEWTPRRFQQQWSQAILINNPKALVEQLADPIQQFTQIAHSDLIRGDQLRIDLNAQGETVVSINDQEVIRSREPLFQLLVNTWIGSRPPSSEFKRDMLAMPNHDSASVLLAEFDALQPSANRRQIIASWFSPQQKKPENTARSVAPTIAAASEKNNQPSPKATNTSKTQTAATTSPAVKKPQPPAASQAAQLARNTTVTPSPLSNQAANTDDSAGIGSIELLLMQEYRSLLLLEEYLTPVINQTQAQIRYPKRAERLRQQGRIALDVTIDRRGNVLNIAESQRHSYPFLVEAAIEGINKASPYPPVPEEVIGDTIALTLPFSFHCDPLPFGCNLN